VAEAEKCDSIEELKNCLESRDWENCDPRKLIQSEKLSYWAESFLKKLEKKCLENNQVILLKLGDRKRRKDNEGVYEILKENLKSIVEYAKYLRSNFV
ncbi:MAG: hypothetical protein QMD12_02575, partial [Candidatus Aenigmarchaeota archaeon]|nr:hypothetical protein [Candidatus Aenigmarchaeota archaeon]